MAEPHSSLRSRNWLFTAFQEPDWLYENYEAVCASKPVIRYLVFQKERCPTSGKPHIQGYIELKNAMTTPALQKLFPGLGKFNTRLRAPNATAEDNLRYCTKEDTRMEKPPVVYGTPGEPGKRTDLSRIAQEVAEGKSLVQVAREDPVVIVRHFRGLQVLAGMFHQPKVRSEPVIRYMWGEPGCGKSRLVRYLVNILHGGEAYWASESDQCWFDGYAGQKVVVFDEFYAKIPLQQMLKILDFGQLRLPVKGSFVNLQANIFYFTANHPPDYCYAGLDRQSAWLSRFDGKRYSDVEIWPQAEIELYMAEHMDGIRESEKPKPEPEVGAKRPREEDD